MHTVCTINRTSSTVSSNTIQPSFPLVTRSSALLTLPIHLEIDLWTAGHRCTSARHIGYGCGCLILRCTMHPIAHSRPASCFLQQS